ncbi:MAG TPA: ester cyclase [Pyrinomonadaceae bacterium]|nr:ester cyclase [Pyrinomonadaceae bacterium]
MQIEENKKLARRWIELISQHKIEEICEMVSPVWKMHGGPPALPHGAEGVRELFRHIGEVQQTWTILDIIAEDDKVVVRAVNTCIQESFFGVPGRGIVQKFSAMFIHKISGGRIVETWRNADDLGRIFQLGGRIEAEIS